jgi:predicted Rdx family selenoprotein
MIQKTYKPETDGENVDIDTKQVLLWDRKAEGGFPGTFYRFILLLSAGCVLC